MTFVTAVRGTETISLAPGIDASRFATERSIGDYYATSHGSQVVGLAFMYPPRNEKPSTKPFFVLFKGTPKELANFMGQHYKHFDHNFKSALEFSRSVMSEQREEYHAKLTIDYECIIPNEPNWEDGVPKHRAQIAAHIKTHVYSKMETKMKDKAIQEDLRFYECHRVLDEERVKVSFHVFARSIVFKNWELMCEVMRAIPTLDGIDMSIYGPGRKFRLPGSWKNNVGDLAFEPVDDQVSSTILGDGWISVCSTENVLDRDFVLDKFPSTKRRIVNSMTPVLPIKRAKRIKIANGLGDAATKILNERYSQNTKHVFDVKVGGSTVNIQSHSASFCFRQPSKTHDHIQSAILVNCQPEDGVMKFTETCFGANCFDIPLTMSSAEKLGILALEVLHWPELDFIGAPFLDKYVLPMLPEGPWRRVYYHKVSGPTQFLVSQQYIVCLHYPDLQLVDRETMALVEFPEDDKKAIVGLLFRDVYYDMESVFTIPGECRSNTSKATIGTLVKKFFVQLMKVRDIRMDDQGTIYQRKVGYDFLYEVIPLDQNQPPGKRLHRWLIQTIEESNHAELKTWTETWIPGKEFTEWIGDRAGICFPVAVMEEAYSFNDGILFLSSDITKDVNTWFKPASEFAPGERYLCLQHIDCDYDTAWQDSRIFEALLSTFEFQGWGDEEIDRNLAVVIGRVVMRWILLDTPAQDKYQFHTIMAAMAASGKTLLMSVVKFLCSKFQVIDKQRTGLGSLVNLVDSNCRLMISEDLTDGKGAMFKGGFDTATFKAVADGSKVTITQLYEGKAEPHVLNSPVIIVSNTTRLGWFDYANESSELDALVRRCYLLNYNKSVPTDKRDGNLSTRALSPTQVGAILVYGIQRYLNVLRKGVDPLCAELQQAYQLNLFEANFVLLSYLRACKDRFEQYEQKNISKIPLFTVYPSPGNYVTPRQIQGAVRDFLKTSDHQSITKFSPSDIGKFAPHVFPNLRVVEGGGSDERQVVDFCRGCFMNVVEGGIRKFTRGICLIPGHHTTDAEHRKKIPVNSMLDFTIIETGGDIAEQDKQQK